MSIKSINIAMGASYGAYSQKLTQATKQELDKLGIPYNQAITEAEGKKLLASYKAQKNETPTKHGTLNNKNKGDNSLFERAKRLATKLGIQVQENIDFEQLISLIQTRLEEEISANQNNISELNYLKALSMELADIQAQSIGSMDYNNSNQTLLKSLEMLSEYNKNFIRR